MWHDYIGHHNPVTVIDVFVGELELEDRGFNGICLRYCSRNRASASGGDHSTRDVIATVTAGRTFDCDTHELRNCGPQLVVNKGT